MVTKKETPAEVYDRMMDVLMTQGIVAAIESLIEVAKDAKAPAPARATAGAALLRAAGMFGTGKEGGPQKSAAETSPDELNAMIATLKQDLARRNRRGGSDDDDGEQGGGSSALFD